VGSRGGGAFADGAPIRVSKVRALDDAHVGVAAQREFDTVGLGGAYRSVTQRCWRPVGYADFWGHMLVAEGALDVMIEPVLNLWDVAALQPIVAEAGGRLSDLGGDGWLPGEPCLTTNGLCHDEVLEILRGLRQGDGSSTISPG